MFEERNTIFRYENIQGEITIPIIYNKEKEGFQLKDPTPEEERALIELGLQYVTLQMGRSIVLAISKQLSEDTNGDIKTEEAEDIPTKKAIH